MDDLRYPLGPYTPPDAITDADLDRWTGEIASLPAALRAAVDGLSEPQLDSPYRPGGWTVRQLVHHVSDSHLNAVARVKLALTEDTPTISPYAEGRWAKLSDYALPVAISLGLLDALHTRWTTLLRSLDRTDFACAFYHPAADQTMRLDWATGMYAWHGRHHVAHVTRWRERESITTS